MNQIEVVNDVNSKERRKKKNFLFSIIIPIYNVEKYIAETIESVIQQTLNFEEHVQLIIVNDGSPDNSEEVCLPYIRKYPKNITYIKKENGGVSSARNLGLKYVQGEYVNFLDSDDKLEENVLEVVYDFFTKNKNEIDIVAIPMQFFDAFNKPHILNYKFKQTRIVNIDENPNFFQLSSSSCFIKQEQAIKYNFDERMKYSEDAKYITEIILDKMKYGVLSDVKYLYRKRLDGSSAVQNGPKVKVWYTESLVYFSEALIEYSLKKMKEVPMYIQHLIMYDLQWRFLVKTIDEDVLNENERQEYVKKIAYILSYIDNKIIFAQKNMGVQLKIAATKLKFSNAQGEFLKYIKLENDVKVYLDNLYLNKLSSERVLIDLIQIKGKQIVLEGNFASCFNHNDITIEVLLNDNPVETIKVNREYDNIRSLGDVVKEIYGFKARINIGDISKENRIYFRITYDNISVLVDYELGPKVNFSKSIPGYYAKDELILHSVYNYIKVIPNSFLKRTKKELGLMRKLFKTGEKYAIQAIVVRLFYYLYILINRSPVHIYMDRIDKAGDNAEVLFRYSNSQKTGIKNIFVISSGSSDYKNLSEIGKVIPYGSRKHRFYMLIADKVISSQADDIVLNPFGKGIKNYKNLVDFDFIFLQHGIIIHDLSEWLYKYSQNIKLFITTSELEYQSIVEGKYGYSKDEVKLLGLPRFDNLENRPTKKILIMPTWRRFLTKQDLKTKAQVYNGDFESSEYFKRFNRLLNDKKLLAEVERYGYKLVFYPHPNVNIQLNDFNIPEQVEVATLNSSYSEYFNTSDLLITDYSSVAYDFAYLRKPLIYYQFEPFHREMGYFDYETMGFGEVYSTHEDLVNQVVNHMKNECKLDEKYLWRIEKFYKYNDRKNCERVYKEILK